MQLTEVEENIKINMQAKFKLNLSSFLTPPSIEYFLQQ